MILILLLQLLLLLLLLMLTLLLRLIVVVNLKVMDIHRVPIIHSRRKKRCRSVIVKERVCKKLSRIIVVAEGIYRHRGLVKDALTRSNPSLWLTMILLK